MGRDSILPTVHMTALDFAWGMIVTVVGGLFICRA